MTAGDGHEIKLWDEAVGRETPMLSDHEAGLIQALAWHPRDLNLVACSDETGVIRVWDLSTHKVRWTFRGDDSTIHSIAWHPTGTLLASSSGKGLDSHLERRRRPGIATIQRPQMKMLPLLPGVPMVSSLLPGLRTTRFASGMSFQGKSYATLKATKMTSIPSHGVLTGRNLRVVRLTILSKSGIQMALTENLIYRGHSSQVLNHCLEPRW